MVDFTGIFVHLVKWCRCNGASEKETFIASLSPPIDLFSYSVHMHGGFEQCNCEGLQHEVVSKGPGPEHIKDDDLQNDLHLSKVNMPKP